MFSKFFKNFTKYFTIVVGVALVAAAIATGVGAALGAAGVFAGGAAGGMAAIWAGAGSAVASVGSAVGISSAFSGIASAIGLTASSAGATLAGASVITTGVYALTAGAAALKTRSEMKAEAKHEAQYANRTPTVRHYSPRERTVARQPAIEQVRNPVRTTQPEMHYKQDVIKSQAQGGHVAKLEAQRGTRSPALQQKQESNNRVSPVAQSHADKVQAAKALSATRTAQLS